MLDSFEKRLELTRSRGMTQLAERLGFNLTNSFAGHGEVLSDFLERVFRASGAQTKAHFDYFFFARCKCA